MICMYVKNEHSVVVQQVASKVKVERNVCISSLKYCVGGLYWISVVFFLSKS